MWDRQIDAGPFDLVAVCAGKDHGPRARRGGYRNRLLRQEGELWHLCDCEHRNSLADNSTLGLWAELR